MNTGINFSEYGDRVCGCIKQDAVQKCPQAVIPSLVVENMNGLKGLSGCFVHVADHNTTFYIDDRGRIILVWAGPVEYDGYDYETNPLRLRSQVVYDFLNNRAIYYNKTGDYRLITLGE